MVLDSQALFSNQQFIDDEVQKTHENGVMIPPRANQATGCSMHLSHLERVQVRKKHTTNLP